MGGRPALEPGTAGRIRFRELPDGRVQARCLFRDFDGHSRPLTRIGATATGAERALQRAVRDRKRVTGDELIRSDMRITDLADIWLERVDASDKATNTKQQYRKVTNAYVRPEIGQLRVQEATVAACDRALAKIRARHGLAVGKSSRAVLSGMLGLAARHDAIPANPVRDTEPMAGASKPKKGRPRALTVAEADDISDRLRTIDRALRKGLDVADLVDFALATGARIGEILACRAASLDLEAGTWEVNATVIRVTGQGLVIQERTKSQAGWRVLALPPFAVALLERRQGEPHLRAPGGVVFGSPHRRSLRDPSNTAADLKECLALLGYHWPTFHTFRKTVATRMDEAGCTPREIADQLGHSKPSMTQNVYMGRNVVSARVAELLDR